MAISERQMSFWLVAVVVGITVSRSARTVCTESGQEMQEMISPGAAPDFDLQGLMLKLSRRSVMLDNSTTLGSAGGAALLVVASELGSWPFEGQYGRYFVPCIWFSGGV